METSFSKTVWKFFSVFKLLPGFPCSLKLIEACLKNNDLGSCSRPDLPVDLEMFTLMMMVLMILIVMIVRIIVIITIIASFS